MGGPGHIQRRAGLECNLPSGDSQFPHAQDTPGTVKAISQGRPSSLGRGRGRGWMFPRIPSACSGCRHPEAM